MGVGAEVTQGETLRGAGSVLRPPPVRIPMTTFVFVRPAVRPRLRSTRDTQAMPTF